MLLKYLRLSRDGVQCTLHAIVEIVHLSVTNCQLTLPACQASQFSSAFYFLTLYQLISENFKAIPTAQ